MDFSICPYEEKKRFLTIETLGDGNLLTFSFENFTYAYSNYVVNAYIFFFLFFWHHRMFSLAEYSTSSQCRLKNIKGRKERRIIWEFEGWWINRMGCWCYRSKRVISQNVKEVTIQTMSYSSLIPTKGFWWQSLGSFFLGLQK